MKRILAIIMTAAMIITGYTLSFADDSVNNDPQTIYVVRNSGAIMLTYLNGECKAEKMATKNKDDIYWTPADLKNIDGSNYVPFRFLFERFGIKEIGKEIEKHVDTESISESEMENNSYVYQFAKSSSKYPNNTTEREKIYIKVKINDKEVLLAEGEDIPGIKDENGNDWKTEGDKTGPQPVLIDGVTYLPLRALKLLDLNVWYDNISDAVFITALPKEDKQCKDATEKYRNIINDNYTTYSDLLKTNGYVRTLKNYLGIEDNSINSVNQYGDLLIYSENDLKLRYTAINDKNDTNQPESKLMEIYMGERNNENKIEDFLVDTFVFDGRDLYGIRIASKDDYEGQLFSMRLEVTYTGEICGIVDNVFDTPSKAYDMVYKKHTTSNDEIKKYIYYLDGNDGYCVKRFNIVDGTNEELYGDDKKLVSASYIGINGKYLFYGNKADKRVNILSFDDEYSNKLQKIYSENINELISVNTGNSGDEQSFYYVENTADNKNRLYKITLSEKLPCSLITESVKIRKLAIFGDKIYCKQSKDGEQKPEYKINGDYVVAINEPESTPTPTPTPEPMSTPTPEPTQTPESTESPVSTETPKVTQTPESTVEPAHK